jgi:hypothetical protein
MKLTAEQARRWRRRLLGWVGTAACALLLGWLVGATLRADARWQTPPGFGRGLLHGALMPLAWPSLLAGNDQEIYAAHNLGRTYKLGYSLGVNGCGAIFFGWFFRRLQRWRRHWQSAGPGAVAEP